jgi:hypothetical protein
LAPDDGTAAVADPDASAPPADPASPPADAPPSEAPPPEGGPPAEAPPESPPTDAPSGVDRIRAEIEAIKDPEERVALRRTLEELAPDPEGVAEREAQATSEREAQQARQQAQERQAAAFQAQTRHDNAYATLHGHFKGFRDRAKDPQLTTEALEALDYDPNIVDQAVEDVVAARSELADHALRRAVSSALNERLTKLGGFTAEQELALIVKARENGGDVLGTFLDELAQRGERLGRLTERGESNKRFDTYKKADRGALRVELMREAGFEPDPGKGGGGAPVDADARLLRLAYGQDGEGNPSQPTDADRAWLASRN